MSQPLIHKDQVDIFSTRYTEALIAPIAPEPNVGDRWFDRTTGVLFTYINDGNSLQWSEFGSAGAVDINVPIITPPNTGEVLPTANPILMLNNQIGYKITTILSSPPVSVPINTRGIIRSIHITNTTNNSELLTAEINYNGKAISISDSVPVEPGSSIELLFRFKVITSNDSIKLQSSANNALTAVIAWGQVSDLTYFGNGEDLFTTGIVTLYTAIDNPAELHSILVVNDAITEAGDIQIIWTNAADAIQGYLAWNTLIPAQATLEILGQHKYLPQGHKIRVLSNTGNEIEVHIAGRNMITTVLPTPPIAGNPDLTLNHQIGSPVTTTISDAGVVIPPNTNGVVRSIHVTNISNASAEIAAEIVYGGTNAISLGENIPVEMGSMIELLYRPKVMRPGDIINLRANINNALHVIIAWGELLDLSYKNGGIDLSTNQMTTIFVAGEATTLETILMVNDSPTNVGAITVVWTDAADVVQGYLAFNMLIPVQSSMELLPTTKWIPTGHKIRALSINSNTIEIHISGKGNTNTITPPIPGLPGSPGSLLFSYRQMGIQPTTILTEMVMGIASGFKAIIKSIHVTNISNGEVGFTGEIDYAGANPLSIADNITLPIGSSMEFIIEDKIMTPADVLRFGSSVATGISVIVSWKEMNDPLYFGTGTDLISTTQTTAYASLGNSAVVTSILISNDSTTENGSITVAWANETNIIQGYLAFNMGVPLQSTLEILQNPKWLPAGHKIVAEAPIANILEIHVSGREQLANVPPSATVDITDNEFIVSEQISLNPTTVLTDSGMIIPVGFVAIIRSIHVTNISTLTAEISGEINYGGTNPISIANSVPIARNSSLELILREKILSDTDTISLQASANSALNVIISWELTGDITYFGDGFNVTDGNLATIFAASGDIADIRSLTFVNDSLTASTNVSALWTNASDVSQGYLIKDMTIAPHSTIEVIEKLKYFAVGDKIKVVATDPNIAVVHIAGKLLMGDIIGINPLLSLNKQISYNLTSVLSDTGMVIPLGSRGIIRSIHITNISSNAINAIADINYGGSNSISLGQNITIRAGSTIDLLFREKIIANGDTINLQADTNNTLQAVIAWEEIADTTRFGVGVDLVSNTLTDIYTATSKSRINSILLVNDSVQTNVITLVWTDELDIVQGYFVNTMDIPPQATIEILEKSKVLPAGHKLKATAVIPNAIELHISGIKI